MLMLWSAPRSRSTAFYRMMTERGDFTAVQEPFSHVAVFGHVEISGRPLATWPRPLRGDHSNEHERRPVNDTATRIYCPSLRQGF
jgi:hypothetical protein